MAAKLLLLRRSELALDRVDESVLCSEVGIEVTPRGVSVRPCSTNCSSKERSLPRVVRHPEARDADAREARVQGRAERSGG